MGKLMRAEFFRAFHNKIYMASIGVGLLICIWHFWENVYPLKDYVYTAQYPLSSFAKWLGGDNSSLQPVLYYLLVPILCALPYAGSYFSDIKTGYVKQVLIRSKKKDYLRSKYIMTFITGATVSAVPLALDFILTGMVLPAVIPQSGTGIFGGAPKMLMADLFYTHPYCYLFLYLILDAVFFGLLTTIALLAAHLTENRFLVILMPFLCYLFVFSVSQMTGAVQLSPFGFLRPSQPVFSTWHIILGELLLLVLGGGIFLYVSTKKEIL